MSVFFRSTASPLDSSRPSRKREGEVCASSKSEGQTSLGHESGYASVQLWKRAHARLSTVLARQSMYLIRSDTRPDILLRSSPLPAL